MAWRFCMKWWEKQKTNSSSQKRGWMQPMAWAKCWPGSVTCGLQWRHLGGKPVDCAWAVSADTKAKWGPQKHSALGTRVSNSRTHHLVFEIPIRNKTSPVRSYSIQFNSISELIIKIFSIPESRVLIFISILQMRTVRRRSSWGPWGLRASSWQMRSQIQDHLTSTSRCAQGHAQCWARRGPAGYNSWAAWSRTVKLL